MANQSSKQVKKLESFIEETIHAMDRQFTSHEFFLKLLHAHQKFGVVLRLRQSRYEQLHGVRWVHVVENPTKDADAAVLFRVHQHLFFSRAAAVDVDGRPNPPVH